MNELMNGRVQQHALEELHGRLVRGSSAPKVCELDHRPHEPVSASVCVCVSVCVSERERERERERKGALGSRLSQEASLLEPAAPSSPRCCPARSC